MFGLMETALVVMWVIGTGMAVALARRLFWHPLDN
jgi:hypothetical protein